MKQIKIYKEDWKFLTSIKGETEQSYADIVKDLIIIKGKWRKNNE